MSDRLVDVIEKYLLKAGKNGKAKLAVAAGISTWTVSKILRGRYVPKPANVFQIAVACGLTPSEAEALASEASEMAARETA